MFKVTNLKSLITTLNRLYWILLVVVGLYLLPSLFYVVWAGAFEPVFYRHPVWTAILVLTGLGMIGFALYAFRQTTTYGWNLKSYVKEKQPRASNQHVALYQILMGYIIGYLSMVGILFVGSLTMLILGWADSLLLTVPLLIFGLWWFLPPKQKIREYYGRLKIEMKKH